MGVEVSCLPLEDALDSTRTDSAPQETEERGAWLAEVQEFDAYVTDPYRLFGIPYDATDKTIKSTYRKLSLKLHPDRCPGDAAAAAKFRQLTAAKDFLLDPYQRRAFNEVHGFLTPTVNVAWWSDWDEVFAELEAEIGTRPPRALHAEKADVLLLGATGLTGTLACMVMSRQAAVGRRSWAIAGRDGRKLLLLQQKFANEAFRGAYRVETTEDDRETGTAVGGEDAGGEEVADVLRSSPRGWRGEEDTVTSFEVEPAAPVPAPAARRSIFNSSNRMRSLHRASVSAAVAMNDETFAKALQAEAEEFGEESAAKITSFEAIANFVIGCIGAGIVVFPKVMALNGYGLALLLILLSAVVCFETGRLMLAACEMAEACTGARPGSMSNYEDLAGAAFGSTGKTVLAITKNSYALGALFVYTVLLVEGVCSLLEFMKPNEDVVRWAVVTPCVLALSMITNLKQLARVAPLGTFAVFAQCAAICVGSVMAHWMDLGVHETKRSEGWRFVYSWTFSPLGLEDMNFLQRVVHLAS
ncbi:Chaperone protein DnaJ [Durusdinium trenchii]|uniref:Chaperone protein DnaJ n=1 Tax=Durusdinium trenchii TaxID=1381693 RepID=A0ABP0QLR9_9DINO